MSETTQLSDVERLAAFIADQITYDGPPDDCCPNCGFVLHAGRVRIDKRELLADAIRRHLGLGSAVGPVVEAAVERVAFRVEDDPRVDGLLVAREVWESVYRR